jgi:hypothetical protein
MKEATAPAVKLRMKETMAAVAVKLTNERKNGCGPGHGQAEE